MQKLIFFFVLLISIALCTPRSMAKENTFHTELRRILDGFIPLEKDNSLLWLGAGSKWKLTSSEGVPDDFAKSMDAFMWEGSKLRFSSEFCQENSYGFKNFIFSGHLDLSQSKNSYSDRRIMLATLPRERGEAGCTQIKGIRDYVGAVSTIEIYRGEVILGFMSREGKPFQLTYEQDHRAERLLQSKWKLTSGNLESAKNCGPLSIRPHGHGGAVFVEALQYYVDGAGWWPDNPNSPTEVHGCSDENRQVEDTIKLKLKSGYEIDGTGHLIVGSRNSDPFVFEPAAVLSDIEGKYKLSGLELKTYNPLFQAAPSERKITDRKALKKLGFKLEVKETQLSFSSECRTITGQVFRRKSNVILVEKATVDLKRDCEYAKNPVGTINRKMSTIVSEKAVVKIHYEEGTGKLTLTRSMVGSPRSLNWIFERQ